VTNEDGTPKLNEKGEPETVVAPDYMVSFYYAPRDDAGNKQTPVRNVILISGPNEDGNYYAMTEIHTKNAQGEYEYAYDYNMIVELDGLSMSFLEWDSYNWIDSGYISMDIAFCQSIKLETKDYSATFTLDNSLSDWSQGKNTKLLSISGTDSLGNTITTFAKKTVQDKYNQTWVITETTLKVYDSRTGEEYGNSNIHYEKTTLGDQVQVNTAGIECANGDKVYVYADSIETRRADGSVEREVRYGTDLFRALYRTFAYASIVDSYPLTDDKKAEIVNDENCIMTLTFTSTEGQVYVYRFYRLSAARKAFITLNGNGEFYVHRQRLDKFVSDCQKFFNLQPIDDTGKT